MRNLYLSVAVLVLATLSVSYQSCVSDVSANAVTPAKADPTEVIWHEIEDLANLQSKQQKPVIIDVYTNWCKWCKVMDEKTFSDSDLAEYLNDNFHMIKLDAETKSDITYAYQTFSYIKSGRRGYHELALALCRGSLSYPSLVVLDEDNSILQVVRGYKDAAELRVLTVRS